MKLKRPTHTQAMDFILARERAEGAIHSVTPASAKDVEQDGWPCVQVTTRSLAGKRQKWLVWLEGSSLYSERT